MIETLKKALAMLDEKDKRKFTFLLCQMFITGGLEAIGALLIIPFVYIVTKPNFIFSNRYLANIYKTLKFTKVDHFIFLTGILVFAFVLVGYVVKAIVNWRITKFVNRLTFTISKQLLHIYLSQPYHWFLHKNSSDLSKMLLSEVNQVTLLVLMPAMQMFANIATSLCTGTLLFIVSPSIAFLSVSVFGTAYLFIYFMQSKRTIRLGKERFDAQSDCYRVAQEAIGGIKEIKVLGLEQGQIINFDRPAKLLASKVASMQILAEMPQYIFQSMAFGGMIAVLLIFMVWQNRTIDSIMPLLAFYSFATIRLLPAFQRIYANFAQIRFGKKPLDTLITDLKLTGEDESPQEYSMPAPAQQWRLNNQISARDIRFNYDNTTVPTLDGASFTIPLYSKVGFTGKSGAGKTTAIDIIIGLLEPGSGGIFIDDIPLNSTNCRSWQQNIGYVPQHVFLTDDTVSANIALGIPAAEIDQDAVVRAAKIADIHSFISERLEKGYDTIVGERGVRFSGGQRQRIGIARALYKNPGILILDEATNAVDNQTEDTILQNIDALEPKKTVIMITHRLSSLKHCDKICVFNNGKVSEHASLDETVSH